MEEEIPLEAATICVCVCVSIWSLIDPTLASGGWGGTGGPSGGGVEWADWRDRAEPRKEEGQKKM